MSDIALIKGGFKKLAENLPPLLAKHADELDLASQRLALKGKMLEDALKEQGAWPIHYAYMKSELDSLAKYMALEVDRVRSEIFRRYETYSRQLSDRTTDKYIDSDPEYLKYQELYLEVKELHDKASAVVDAFSTRGFALRDITAIRVNQLHTTVL